MEEIILDDGKYRFFRNNCTLYCDRYNAFWRSFVGDHAVNLLFDECIESQKEVARLHALLRISVNRAP